MAKLSLKNRILQRRVSTIVLVTLCLIAFIQLFAHYGVYNYKYLPLEVIETQLYKQITPTLVHKKGKPDCSYGPLLKSTKTINAWEVPSKYDDFLATGVMNGTYTPEHCNPLFSVAILVTYRNRQSQLDIFLPYIHNFLRKQNIHYKVYLIEQQDENIWNKGILWNLGAKEAIADKFPCLILHDVDLLPLDEANLYACSNAPRHMSAVIDKFRNVLPYSYLVGGALAIKADHFVAVNGFSNRFEGWGGEDDDFAYRIASHNLEIIRFPRHMSRYTMLIHPPESKNIYREHIMAENRRLSKEEGLNSVRYRRISLKNNRLFTLIGVKL